MPVGPPSELLVSEQSHAPDRNKNTIDAVQPLSETIEVEDVNEDDKEESGSDYGDSVNSESGVDIPI